MNNTSFQIKNFGPIKDANIELGDLTFFVGPQGSGKSLMLELFKYIVDSKHILSTLKRYNYILRKDDPKNIIEDYFGEGLSCLFKKNTSISLFGKSFGNQDLLNTLKSWSSQNDKVKESVFYVPAQRIMSIADGRPKNFMEFDITSPYVLRIFSETLRVFIQGGLGNPDIIFPMGTILKEDAKKSIDETIFHGAKVILDTTSGQRKMKLKVDGMNLPFMAWSAGQREFMPLLLAVYCLSGYSSAVIDKQDYEWVVIEEPEMGLHPKAIEAVILEIIELIRSGYKVLISTHSSTLLDFAWAFNMIKNADEKRVENALCEMFDLPFGCSTSSLFKGLNKKNIRTYFAALNDDGAQFQDISTLDVCSENTDIAEWGGLSSFAGKVSDIVSRSVNQ